jgi:hypothetical protein
VRLLSDFDAAKHCHQSDLGGNKKLKMSCVNFRFAVNLVTQAPAFTLRTDNQHACERTKQLGQRVHCSVEEVWILKVRLVAGLLVWNRLQTCRERFVPLRRERSNVSEDTFHLIEGDLAGERNRIQAGTANGRVSDKRAGSRYCRWTQPSVVPEACLP